MPKQQKAAWAEISTADIKYNINTIRSVVGKDKAVCGILKADAYGHGIMGIRKFLGEKKLVNMIAVGKMSELLQISSVKWEDDLKTLLLGGADDLEIEDCLLNHKVMPEMTFFSVYSVSQFFRLYEIAERLGMCIKVHIRLDGWNSGMGISYEDFLLKQDEFFSQDKVEVCGVYSHLYTSYSNDRIGIKKELEGFDRMVKKIKPRYREKITIHILNSALVFAFPEYAYDMVRVGTAMYGLPCGTDMELRPALRICARIFDVRNIDKSVPLSYEPENNTTGIRRIARIFIGYWDNPLLLTQKDVRVKIRDRIFTLADDVCMDNLCIDVTGNDDIVVGDEAVLLGESGVTVDEILKRNGIKYVHSEWLCMTAGRLEKIYI